MSYKLDFYESSHGAFSKILSEVLPCIWKEDGRDDYFPLMAELGRIFEHTKVMEKHVYPAIEESIHPDVLTYALAFMVLF